MTQTIALVGPTGVGKTDVSIALARRLSTRGGSARHIALAGVRRSIVEDASGGDAEIVGCDSMQVYRRMAMLTQQPTPAQRAEIPHHLIDCVEPAESFSVGQYRPMALAAIHAIHQRGQSVVLVGGTGLYLKALTKGLCSAPPADDHVRAQLWEAIQQQGSPVFHERLQRIDPLAASKIHPNDARRLVRALEVYELTGKPLSNFWKQSAETDWSITTAPALQRMVLIGLTRDRDELYERINRRVERMIREEGVLHGNSGDTIQFPK